MAYLGTATPGGKASVAEGSELIERGKHLVHNGLTLAAILPRVKSEILAR